MVMDHHVEQPDTMKGKGSSSSTAKLDYFSGISIDFPIYCWVKGQVFTTEQGFWSIKLVANVKSGIVAIYPCHGHLPDV